MKNNNPKPIQAMDERQKSITQKAICNAFFFLIACMFVATIYRVSTTGDCGWELFGIFGAALVILISRRVMGDIEQPLDIRNRPLPTGNTKSEKLARIRNYLAGSSLFGAACAVGDILLVSFGENEVSEYELAELIFPSLSKELTIALTALIAFAVSFLLSYLFDYCIGEFYTLKRYNKMLRQLEADDEEI